MQELARLEEEKFPVEGIGDEAEDLFNCARTFKAPAARIRPARIDLRRRYFLGRLVLCILIIDCVLVVLFWAPI